MLSLYLLCYSFEYEFAFDMGNVGLDRPSPNAGNNCLETLFLSF
jgi:hypothetical protein